MTVDLETLKADLQFAQDHGEQMCGLGFENAWALVEVAEAARQALSLGGEWEHGDGCHYEPERNYPLGARVPLVCVCGRARLEEALSKFEGSGRIALSSKKPTRIGFGDKCGDYENEVEIPDGSMTVYFDDGTFAIFTAVWHNDSTAGLYVSFKEATQ